MLQSTVPPASERLTFRTWRADDLELAMSLWGDPRVTALIDARGALGRDAVEARLRSEIALQERHGIQYWPALLTATGELAGCAGLHPRDPAARVYELGFHLRPAFWGTGMATEAARAVARFAFEALDASALFAGHHRRTPHRHASSPSSDSAARTTSSTRRRAASILRTSSRATTPDDVPTSAPPRASPCR